MFNDFAEYPAPLKKKIYLFVVMATTGLIATLVSLFTKQSFYIMVPFIAVFGIGLFFAISLIQRIRKDKITKIEGNVVEVLKTFSGTAYKTVFFNTGDKRVQIHPKERYKRIHQGDHIVVFVKDDLYVYMEDGNYVINDYIAMQITTVATEEEPEAKKALKDAIVAKVLKK